MKFVKAFLGFLLIFKSTEGLSADLGVHGTLFPVKEASLLDVIEQRLRALKSSGALEAFNKELASRVQKTAHHPTPVEGLQKAHKRRIFNWNPTLCMKENILDHEGRVVVKKGTSLNPLHFFSWGRPLLIIDGEDETQIKWALHQAGQMILVRGSPLQLEERLKRPVYFDQWGKITTQFGIRFVPAKVYQQGEVLKIEETPPTGDKKGEN